MNDLKISSSGIHFEDWGLIDYQEALTTQLEILQKISEGKAMPTVVFCSHPAIVTLGRGTQPGDVFGWKGPTLEVSRGGRATYHGPSQIVMYAILDLNRPSPHRGSREIVGFLRDFERCIVEALKDFGISAEGKSLQKHTEAEATEETGVWVGRKKIASLGIAVKKWISYHGAALNLTDDPEAFQGLKPCGFDSQTMTSVEKVLGRAIPRSDMMDSLRDKVLKYL